MTSYKPGQIVLIPFPFTDLSTHKQRPAMILSSVRFNRAHSDFIIAAITSQLTYPLDADEYLLSESELRAGGLPKASMVKLGKIVTLDQRLVRRTLGQLPQASTRRISAAITQIISS